MTRNNALMLVAMAATSAASASKMPRYSTLELLSLSNVAGVVVFADEGEEEKDNEEELCFLSASPVTIASQKGP